MRYHLNEHPVTLLLTEEYLPIEEFYSPAYLLDYPAHQAMEETNYENKKANISVCQRNQYCGKSVGSKMNFDIRDA